MSNFVAAEHDIASLQPFSPTLFEHAVLQAD